MVHSMTGYGSAKMESENYKVSVELKSLNSKYIEINMKLPRTYMHQEMSIRNVLTKLLERGKVNAVMTVEVLNPNKHRLRINESLVTAYAAELDQLRQKLDLQSEIDMEFLLSLPDAVKADDNEADPEEWKLIDDAFHEAAKRLIESRAKEGKALEADLRNCSEGIAAQLEEIRALLPVRLENIRSRLSTAIQEVRDRAQVDGNRYEQELIYYIEKLDINEEMVRLVKHLDFFEQTLASDKRNGKKLGFIAQEMGREINTIGSKANHAGIQVYVVRMKEDLEKIKEQVLNIV